MGDLKIKEKFQEWYYIEKVLPDRSSVSYEGYVSSFITQNIKLQQIPIDNKFYLLVRVILHFVYLS